MKYLQTHPIHEDKSPTANAYEEPKKFATKQFVKDFLLDFGTLISLNFSQVTKMGKDDNSTSELTSMMQALRKPIINGLSYFEFLNSNLMDKTISNSKLLPEILGVVRDYLAYIEPRIKRFVKDDKLTDEHKYKEGLLNRIEKIKNDYIKIIS